ncbi:ArnT family glycosyltransferase [bacterium]
MGKKKKNKKKNLKNIEPANNPVQEPYFVSLLPKFLIYSGMLVFIIIVLKNYFHNYPVSPSSYISMFFHFLPNRAPTFFTVLTGVLNILMYSFITLCIFVSFGGYGKLLRDKIIKFKTDFSLFIDIGIGIIISILFAFLISFFTFFKPAPVYLFFIIGIICAVYTKFIFLKKHDSEQTIVLSKDEIIGSGFFKLLIAVISAQIIVNVINASTPETFYDSMVYHLGLPQLWINKSKIFFPRSHIMALTPLNIEIIYSLAMIIKNDILAKYIHIGFSILTLLLIYECGKRYFSKSIGIIAALIFYTTPIVNNVVYKTAIELSIGFFEVLCFVLFLAWIKSENLKDKIKYIILSGIFLGIALGSKYTSFFSMLGFFTALAIIGKDQKFSKEFIKHSLFFIVSALVISMPWYIRNFINTGNPVFPLFCDKIGYLYVRGGTNYTKDPPAIPFTLSNYLFFPWKLTMGKLSQEVLSGPIYLLLTPLIILQRFSKTCSKLIKIALVYIIIYTILWTIKGNMYLRYFVPALPVLALILSVYLIQNDWKAIYKKLAVLIITILCTLNIIFIMFITYFNNQSVDYVFGKTTKAQYLSTQRSSYPNPSYHAVLWINKNLTDNSKVLCIGETRVLFMKKNVLITDISMDNPLVNFLKESKDEQELYNKFKEDRITHLLINPLEAIRLPRFDMFFWDIREFIIFDKFIKKHTIPVFRMHADALLNNGLKLLSDVPEYLEEFRKNDTNYIYIYEVVKKIPPGSPASFNFLILPHVYKKDRWKSFTQYPDFNKYLKQNYPDLWKKGIFKEE